MRKNNIFFPLEFTYRKWKIQYNFEVRLTKKSVCPPKIQPQGNNVKNINPEGFCLYEWNKWVNSKMFSSLYNSQEI